MGKHGKWLVAVGVCMWMLLVGVATMQAAEEKTVTVTGVVNITEDDDGNVTSVTLRAGDGVYSIVLDEKGMKLGVEMSGEKVEVTGTLSVQGGKKTLKVKSFKAVVEDEDVDE